MCDPTRCRNSKSSKAVCEAVVVLARLRDVQYETGGPITFLVLGEYHAARTAFIVAILAFLLA